VNLGYNQYSMAAGIGGCCGGTKKQKLSNCSPIALNSNGINGIEPFNGFVANGNGVVVGVCGPHSHQITKNGMIVSSDMCFFCFDVLHLI